MHYFKPKSSILPQKMRKVGDAIFEIPVDLFFRFCYELAGNKQGHLFRLEGGYYLKADPISFI
jgi:hypothetical protein